MRPDAQSSPSLDFNPSKRLAALAVLGLLGTGVSAYLTQHYYEVRGGLAGFKSFCNLGQGMNCDVVAASRYAELFAGLPISSFAAGWFIALFVVALIARNPFWRREGVRALLALTGFAALMSLAYLAIMIGVLKTYCLFCLATDAIAFIAFAIVLSLKPEGTSRHPLDGSKWKTFTSITGVSIFIAVVGLRGMDPASFSSTEANDAVQSILNTPVMAVGATTDLPSLGPDNAPITIVEFSDFQCPFCRLGAFSLNTVLQQYPTQVRVVFRNFPLDQACNRKIERAMHVHACEAAKVTVCAHKQGKFAEVYEALFEHQDEYAHGAPQGKVTEIAQRAGADLAQLSGCVSAPETTSAVSRDIEEGINLGIASTPTFFINGRKVEGGKPPAVWSRVIDELLKQQGR